MYMHSDTGGESIPVLYNLRDSTADVAGLHAFTQDNQHAGMCLLLFYAS